MRDETVTIFNLDQQPFENFDMAVKMRDLLSNESVHQYRIDLFEIGNESAGFVIKRIPKKLELSKGNKQQTPSMDDIKKTFHPALRTYLLYCPLVVIALVLVLFTVELWAVVLSILDIKGLPDWVNGEVLVNSTQMIGSVGIIWILLTVLINYYGTTLLIDSHGLTFNKGIVTRDVTHIRFAEIRTIGLRQGLLDRLLNIGILEFSSSGTDDVDIRFINIANPTGIKSEIETIIEQQIKGQ